MQLCRCIIEDHSRSNTITIHSAFLIIRPWQKQTANHKQRTLMFQLQTYPRMTSLIQLSTKNNKKKNDVDIWKKVKKNVPEEMVVIIYSTRTKSHLAPQPINKLHFVGCILTNTICIYYIYT